MKASIGDFFPSGTEVLVIPSVRRAKYYMASGNILQRWRNGGFYPAYGRWTRMLLVPLKVAAAMGLFPKRPIGSSRFNEVATFVRTAVPEADTISVVPSRSPVKRYIVRLANPRRQIAFLKYVEEAAVQRLLHEKAALEQLPEGLAPKVLKAGELLDGYGMLTEALAGTPLPVTLTPPPEAVRFAERLIQPVDFPIYQHPWIVRLSSIAPYIKGWLRPLANRAWPLALQHGDFAPWNLLRASTGEVRAIDWEYYEPEAFPYLDVAYFSIRVCQSVLRTAPTVALRSCTRSLATAVSTITPLQAEAIVRLTALDYYIKSLRDGQKETDDAQQWRLRLACRPRQA